MRLYYENGGSGLFGGTTMFICSELLPQARMKISAHVKIFNVNTRQSIERNTFKLSPSYAMKISNVFFKKSLVMEKVTNLGTNLLCKNP